MRWLPLSEPAGRRAALETSIVAIRTQLRPISLVEGGAEIPTRNPHVTCRAQGHALFCRVPNFNQSVLANSRRYAMVENRPSA